MVLLKMAWLCLRVDIALKDCSICESSDLGHRTIIARFERRELLWQRE